MKFNCSQCGQHLEADENMAGMQIDCPSCSVTLKVPAGDGQHSSAQYSEHRKAPPPLASSFGSNDETTMSDFKTSLAERPILASAWQRLGGNLIDLVAIVILAALLARVLMHNSDLSAHAEMAKAAFWNAFGWYYWLFECIFGRTLGKFATATKVVAIDSTAPASWWRVALRMLLRLVPFEPLSYFITGQRGVMWHDRWTGTRVIKWPPSMADQTRCSNPKPLPPPLPGCKDAASVTAGAFRKNPSARRRLLIVICLAVLVIVGSLVSLIVFRWPVDFGGEAYRAGEQDGYMGAVEYWDTGDEHVLPSNLEVTVYNETKVNERSYTWGYTAAFRIEESRLNQWLTHFPLHLAARAGDVSAVKRLLENGHNPNEEPIGALPVGILPLYLAAAHGHAEVVELLLKYGADINRGRSPLDIAIKRNQQDVVKVLEKYSKQKEEGGSRP